MYTGPQIITDGLILYVDAANPKSYPGSGTTWEDLSESNNDGTLVNDPTFNPTYNGNFSFDGTNDYSQFGSLGNFSSNIPSQGCTIEMYIQTSYVDSVKQFGILNDYRTLVIINFNRNRNDEHQERFTSFALRDDSNNYQIGAMEYNIYDNKPHHVVFVKPPSSQTIQIFVDGEEKAVEYNDSLESLSNMANLQYPFTVGGVNNRGTYRDFLECTLPLFKIYNRNLSQFEVLQNYNATKQRFK